mgnify:CR=1 FL=1
MIEGRRGVTDIRKQAQCRSNEWHCACFYELRLESTEVSGVSIISILHEIAGHVAYLPTVSTEISATNGSYGDSKSQQISTITSHDAVVDNIFL